MSGVMKFSWARTRRWRTPTSEWGGLFGGAALGVRQQAELRGTTHRTTPAGHAELRVDVPRMGADRRKGDDELSSYVRPAEVALQQTQDIELALAQGLDQGLVDLGSPSSLRLAHGRQESTSMVGRVGWFRGDSQEGRH